MTRTQEPATDGALGDVERRHLLRRLAFAATPALEEALSGLSAAEALAVLVRAARDTPHPERPEAARGVWRNPGLRFAGMSDEDFEAMLDRLAPGVRAAVDDVRRPELLSRLDPAPGLDAAAIEREVSGVTSSEGRGAFIRRVMMSPEYQLA